MKIMIAATLSAGLFLPATTDLVHAASSAPETGAPSIELRTVPRPQPADRTHVVRDRGDAHPAVRFVSSRGDDVRVRRFDLRTPLVLGIFR